LASILDLLAIDDPVERALACNEAIDRARDFIDDALALRNAAILDQMDNPDVGYGRAAKASGIGRTTAANLHYQADTVRERAEDVKRRWAP
jgi:hypothetical protein